MWFCDENENLLSHKSEGRWFCSQVGLGEAATPGNESCFLPWLDLLPSGLKPLTLHCSTGEHSSKTVLLGVSRRCKMGLPWERVSEVGCHHGKDVLSHSYQLNFRGRRHRKKDSRGWSRWPGRFGGKEERDGPSGHLVPSDQSFHWGSENNLGATGVTGALRV